MTRAFTLVYDGDVYWAYHFDERSYDTLAAAGIAWQDVSHVLHDATPTLRRHTGAVLRVAGYTRRGELVGIALIEEAEDDQYLVVGARVLEGDEREAVAKLIEGIN